MTSIEELSIPNKNQCLKSSFLLWTSLIEAPWYNLLSVGISQCTSNERWTRSLTSYGKYWLTEVVLQHPSCFPVDIFIGTCRLPCWFILITGSFFPCTKFRIFVYHNQLRSSIATDRPPTNFLSLLTHVIKPFSSSTLFYFIWFT